MGRVAAAAWIVAGAWVLLDAIYTLVGDARLVLGPYGSEYWTRDMRVGLVGAAIAVVAGIAALAAARQAWRGNAHPWLAFPAIVLVSGAVWIWGIGSWRLRFLAGASTEFASPFFVFLLPIALLYAGSAIIAICVIDRLVSAGTSAAP